MLNIIMYFDTTPQYQAPVITFSGFVLDGAKMNNLNERE